MALLNSLIPIALYSKRCAMDEQKILVRGDGKKNAFQDLFQIASIVIRLLRFSSKFCRITDNGIRHPRVIINLGFQGLHYLN